MVAEVIIGTIWNKYLICLINSKEKELTLVQIMSLKFKWKILKMMLLYCIENGLKLNRLSRVCAKNSFLVAN